MDQTDHFVPIAGALIDALADRVAEKLADRLGEPLRQSASWRRTKDAADYLGLTRSALYSRIREVPHYRFEQMLLSSPVSSTGGSSRTGSNRRGKTSTRRRSLLPITSRSTSSRRRPAADAIPRTLVEPPKERRKRERPLPPPLCGDEAQKLHWAKELEVSREDVDQMSPGDFKRAWYAPQRAPQSRWRLRSSR